MDKERLVEQLRVLLGERDVVAFAYLHGSVLYADEPGDVDLAVYLREETYAELASAGTVNLEFAIPLEFAVEAAIQYPADVHVINRAPLPFRARVVSQGMVLVDRAPDARADFEYLTRYEFFDFRPRLEEYWAEILA